MCIRWPYAKISLNHTNTILPFLLSIKQTFDISTTVFSKSQYEINEIKPQVHCEHAICRVVFWMLKVLSFFRLCYCFFPLQFWWLELVWKMHLKKIWAFADSKAPEIGVFENSQQIWNTEKKITRLASTELIKWQNNLTARVPDT